ncbi:MAG TPA: thermonuclease family protein [Longimicrobiales bacterium]|nr:thermonuclease family protein [Longimicrobiales bacterium]
MPRSAVRSALLVAALLTAACGAGAQQVPERAAFAASLRGQVFYPIECPAWRGLASRNLIFFRSAEDAEEAGFRPTRNPACAAFQPPRELAVPAREVNAFGVPGRTIVGGCIVREVVDGDTVDCQGGVRIRLLLIDAPETAQSSYGLRATLALEELLPVGDTVAVEVDLERHDRYGRLLAHLHRGGRWVNQAMVRRGYAVPLVYPPNIRWVEEIRAAADSARAERVGLWEVDAFKCLPRDFRAGRCRG